MKGTIIFEDNVGKTCQSSINGVTDKAALGTFCNALDSYSNAKITQYSVVDATDFAGTIDGTGLFQSVEQKLLLTFRYFDANNDKHYTKLALPCPADVVISHLDKVGWRAVKAQGDAIAAMLSTATGRTMAFTRGTAISNPTQSQA